MFVSLYLRVKKVLLSSTDSSLSLIDTYAYTWLLLIWFMLCFTCYPIIGIQRGGRKKVKEKAKGKNIKLSLLSVQNRLFLAFIRIISLANPVTQILHQACTLFLYICPLSLFTFPFPSEINPRRERERELSSTSS